ncbi:hypothetical protein [Paenibacillus daejeonensis]|uniref:hypothetical protein n=1 Tax=Paenibacillus daejeonensis TaxID=135193 RepID=UPI00037F2F28|nr:hypothetical protein [Paenibacillus daejeonensis]
MKTNLKLPATLIGTMLLLTVTGCSEGAAERDHTAILTIQDNSSHIDTFSELSLGHLFDYNLELKEADRLWTKLWVEGYEPGDTKVLGAIRNGTPFIQQYDLREATEIERMIAEEKQVFFLKMNLEYIDGL